jgi:hypothetical protein
MAEKSLANLKAVALPIPELDPVTIATEFVISAPSLRIT